MNLLSISLLLSSLFVVAVDGKRKSDNSEKGPPPFFLQDSTDGLCLSGEGFKRCAIDTLFYVVGSPGTYQIHKRPVDNKDGSTSITTASSDDDDSNNLCISKKSCSPSDVSKVLPVKLAKCTHCGAKSWNILGDATTGYVLSENEVETCLFRTATGNRAVTAPCDSKELTYTPLQLQFATPHDILLMDGPGAQLIAAAADGDKKLVEKLLLPKNEVDKDDSSNNNNDKVDVNARDWDDLTALTPAAANGHYDVVKLLIENGADVNLGDKDGITPLMEASIMGHLKIATLLIEEGATVDAKATSGVTALWLASGEGKMDVVSLLLKGQADPNNVRSDGITAIMTASANGHSEAVKMLLDEGADAEASDQDGLTPLMNAAESGSIDVLKLLVESVASKKEYIKSEGSDDENGEEDSVEASRVNRYVDRLSDTGFTALIVAAAHGHTDAINFLLESEASIDFFHESGVTALMYAAAGGHTDATSTLIEHGAGVNILHSNGGSALLEASTAGALGALEVLIEHGAQVDIIDNDGVTPIMSAASQGHMECLTMLLDAVKTSVSDSENTDYLNLLSNSGGSAIMFAAGGGHANATLLLIERGADIDAIARATPEYLLHLKEALEQGTATEDQQEPHVDGVTALHVAAEGGHLDCVTLLLKHNNAELVDLKDDDNRTPLLLAIKGNFGEVASELVRHGADANTKYVDDDGDHHNLLMDALIVENEEFATLLIENGCDLYYVDEHNVSTLLQAAHRGMEAVVKEMLGKNAMDKKTNNEEEQEQKAEAYINLASDEGITPLIAAASEGHPTIVSLLLEAGGADVNLVDKDGTSALMAAAARGHEEAVLVLLQTGNVEVNTQNVDGHTALMFAYNGKNQVETLWERYDQFVEQAKATSSPTIETRHDDDSESNSDSSSITSSIGATGNGNVNDGGSGSVIKDALVKHTALVQLLLKHGADENLKDKEGHTAKDFDFHPEMDVDVLKQEEIAEKRRDGSKNEL